MWAAYGINFRFVRVYKFAGWSSPTVYELLPRSPCEPFTETIVLFVKYYDFMKLYYEYAYKNHK